MKPRAPQTGAFNSIVSCHLPENFRLLIPLFIFILLSAFTANAQNRVSGTVREEGGDALIGVSIKVKNAAGSSSTNVNGEYTITVPSGNATLVFSYVGYETKEVAVNGRSVVDVQMKTDARSLSEVVVVGYGTQRKSDLTGAVSSVKPEDIDKRPVTRIDQALQGEVPGVSVTSTSGNPGAPLAVRIRGGNSISANNDPLYVIDGFIGANITSINVNDIASMEILKDASATAIYGSRGANGVVLITTKSGKSGQTQVNFDTWFSRSEIAKRLDLLNAYDFAVTANAQNAALERPEPFSQAQLETFKTKSTDWQDELFREGWSQNYQLDVSGGSQDVRYMLSGNILDQKGLILNSNYKKSILRANIDATLSSKVDFKLNLNAVQAKGHNNSFTGARNDPFSQVTVWDPTSPVYDDNGKFITKSNYGSIQINPISQVTNGLIDNNLNDYTATGILSIKVLKDLTLSINGSVQNSSQYNPTLLGFLTDVGTAGNPRIDVGNVKYNNYQNSNILTYNKEFNKKHSLTLTGVYEIQHSETTANGLSVVGLTTEAAGYYDPAVGKVPSVNGSFSDQSLTSYLGRVNYTFNNKYSLTASYRADGSSRLSEGNKFSYFPSAALAWRIIEEPFMKDQTLFDNLKLRVSYGETGNQSVNPYGTLAKMITGQNYYFNGTSPAIGIGLGTLPSTDLNWERNRQTNLGLDASILKGRVTLTAELYKKVTYDLLLSYGIPQYLGGGSYLKNISDVGTVENKGLELDLGATPVITKNWKWNSSFNISFNNNKILDLGGQDNIVRSVANVQTNILKKGRPFSQFYGYKYLGTWKSSEAAEAALYNKVPGDAKFLDVDGNKVYTPNDRVIIGNGTPKYTFGFSNDVSYKNFSLNVLFQGAQNFDIFSQTLAYTFGSQGDARNATNAEVLNRWTPQNETDIPAFSKTASTPVNSSRYIYDGSYIKLKNLSLNYNLPASLLARIKSRSMSVFVSSQNTFTITKFPGYDPEVTNGGADVTQGTEWGVLPNPRTFTLGLRFGL